MKSDPEHRKRDVSEGWTTAIKQWQTALGIDAVNLFASDAVAPSATFHTAQTIGAELFPKSTSQVQACLKVAQHHSLPIYPISRGRNCGYGSRVPYENNSAILDLRFLDQIDAYDPELGTIRLQAGVTQTQLADYLAAHGARHIVDPIATFPDCSVVGNILERGHGMTAYGDRIASSCDYEVVLPTGELLQTGYSDLRGARAHGLDRWAPGPQLDGLFSQSNFGVVTAMTVWLMPRPERTRLLALPVSTDADFVALLELLRPLRLDGTLRFGPRFYNEYRLIQTFSDYPWDEMAGQTPFTGEPLERRMRELEIPKWTCLLGFYGSAERIAADELQVRRALGGRADAAFVVEEPNDILSEDKQNILSKFARASLAAMRGRVAAVTQRPRWRKRPSPRGSPPQPRAGDWSKENCGLIWCPVTAPFRGADVAEAVAIYRRVFLSFGFEPDMSVSSVRERTVELNASLVFDREEPKEEKAALKCVSQTLHELAEAGFYPHRLGLATMPLLDEQPRSSSFVIESLRATLDPNGILADGRYVRARRPNKF